MPRKCSTKCLTETWLKLVGLLLSCTISRVASELYDQEKQNNVMNFDIRDSVDKFWGKRHVSTRDQESNKIVLFSSTTQEKSCSRREARRAGERLTLGANVLPSDIFNQDFWL